MALKKIPKKVWMKFSDEEKEYHTLEYKKAFEKNRMRTVYITRAIALLCVFALFFVGFAMISNAKEFGQIKDTYGPDAYCYLCGLESLKKCECQYISNYGFNKGIAKDLDNYALSLADYNVKECASMAVQNGSYAYAGYEIPLDLEETTP